MHSRAFALLASLLALSACGGAITPRTGPQAAAQTAKPNAGSSGYTFTTLDDPQDPQYNVLTGIADTGAMVGYYGGGASETPAHGYLLYIAHGSMRYVELDAPGADATQPWCLTDSRTVAGDYTSKSGTYPFVRAHGVWSSIKSGFHGSALVEFRGIGGSREGIVGFYALDGVNRAFEFADGDIHRLRPPGATSAVAAGINRQGSIAGWMTDASGATLGWVKDRNAYAEFQINGGATQAYAINARDQIVGSFVDSEGAIHGFVQSAGSSDWTQIDDPNAAGSTVVTSINDRGDLVGYYLDASGATNGFLATRN